MTCGGGVVLVIVLIVIAQIIEPKTISLRESEWNCTLKERSNARNGCVVYKYIGDG